RICRRADASFNPLAISSERTSLNGRPAWSWADVQVSYSSTVPSPTEARSRLPKLSFLQPWSVPNATLVASMCSTKNRTCTTFCSAPTTSTNCLYHRMLAEPLNAFPAWDFFVTANHLVDWIWPSAGSAQHRVERRWGTIPRICEHLANGAKHFIIN